MMDVRILESQDYPQWEQYVIQSSQSNIFHRIGWLKVVQETYGHTPMYLVASRNGKITGILPLFLVDRPLIGPIVASDVFTSYGGICADDAETERALATEAARLTAERHGSYLEIKNKNEICDMPEKWKTKLDFCTLFLDLQNGAEFVWNSWRGKTRNEVRKAVKSHVTVEEGHHLLKEFYKLVVLDMKRLGTPVHSERFYRNILEQFGHEARIFIAQIDGKAISSVLTLRFKDCIHAFLCVSDRNFKHLRPNSVLYWEVIKHACAENLKVLDFGRSTWDSGTFQFKKTLGGIPVKLNYMYFLNKAKTIPHIHQDNKKLQLARFVWQGLPINLTKVFGPSLIKYVV